MPPDPDSALVLFPGALGDFVCFLPALRGLRARHAGALRLLARPALLDLIRLPGLSVASIERREVADLFACGTPLRAETAALLGGFAAVYSWTGFGDADVGRRLAAVSGGGVGVYRFRGMQPGEHAAAYYARCAGVPAATPVDPLLVADADWLRTFEERSHLHGRRLIVLHPGSGAPAKNWTGYAAVAERWAARAGETVIVLHGPAETEGAAATIPGTVPARDLSLRQVTALLRRCALYLGNDSGISHLAGAVGVCGVVCFGSTDPRIWAPGGSLRVLHAPDPCRRCPQQLCTHRVPVGRVLQALAEFAPP